MPTLSNGAANGSAAAAATTPAPAPTDANPAPSISWPVNRPASRGNWTPEVDHEIRLREQKDVRTAPAPAPAAPAPAGAPQQHQQQQQQQQQKKGLTFPVSGQDLLPGQPRSLSGIGFRAWALGQALGLGLAGTLYLAAVARSTLWRAPLFVAVLALFHFLEFWTTARYNTPAARTLSFLFSNGKEYQLAHSTALAEHLITHFCLGGGSGSGSGSSGGGSGSGSGSGGWHAKVGSFGGATAAAGIALIVLGQVVRSVAMAQAGTNFNHMVQSSKKSDHVLVTKGIYGVLRHPSYFGFFWWGLGTQLMLGNVVCFLIYAGVLWKFFSRRILHEERFLINFFGEEYRKYRAETTVAIPFIP